MNCPGTFTTQFKGDQTINGKRSAICEWCWQRVPLQTDPSPKSERLVLAQHEARKP